MHGPKPITAGLVGTCATKLNLEDLALSHALAGLAEDIISNPDLAANFAQTLVLNDIKGLWSGALLVASPSAAVPIDMTVVCKVDVLDRITIGAAQNHCLGPVSSNTPNRIGVMARPHSVRD